MNKHIIKITENRTKLNYLDILLIVTILLQDAGSFGLPLNLYQITILAAFGVIAADHFSGFKKAVMSDRFLVLLLYIFIITIGMGAGYVSLKYYIFIVIESAVIYGWLRRMNDYEKLYRILYRIALVMAVIGIIQEAGYIAGIPYLYNHAYYGFQNILSIRHGILAVTSLCSEPSHCAGFVAFGLWIGLIKKDRNYTSFFRTSFITVCAVLTQSLVVYVTGAAVFAAYIFYHYKYIEKDRRKLILILAAAGFLSLIMSGIGRETFGRLEQFRRLDANTSSDLSALSLVSNYKIAAAKMRDGYIFGTGINTHRSYYYDYIHKIYNNIYMYLNDGDAGSLYLRIFSEFGITGFILLLGFIFANLYKSYKKRDLNVFTFTILFAVLILRNGHYETVLNLICMIAAFLMPCKKIKKQKIE